MKNRIDKLIFQFQNVFDGTPYYGDSIQSIIELIPYESANNSINNGHTIAQIIEHMLAWRLLAIEHLKGNVHYDIELGSDNDWTSLKITSQSEWIKLKQAFAQSHETLIELLKQKEDRWLSSKLEGKVFSYNFLLKGIIQHDIYHIGQVNLLKNSIHIIINYNI